MTRHITWFFVLCLTSVFYASLSGCATSEKSPVAELLDPFGGEQIFGAYASQEIMETTAFGKLVLLDGIALISLPSDAADSSLSPLNLNDFLLPISADCLIEVNGVTERVEPCPVADIFQSFYQAHGGDVILGRPVSQVSNFILDGQKIQRFENAILVADASNQVHLMPISGIIRQALQVISKNDVKEYALQKSTDFLLRYGVQALAGAYQNFEQIGNEQFVEYENLVLKISANDENICALRVGWESSYQPVPLEYLVGGVYFDKYPPVLGEFAKFYLENNRFQLLGYPLEVARDENGLLTQQFESGKLAFDPLSQQVILFPPASQKNLQERTCVILSYRNLDTQRAGNEKLNVILSIDDLGASSSSYTGYIKVSNTMGQEVAFAWSYLDILTTNGHYCFFLEPTDIFGKTYFHFPVGLIAMTVDKKAQITALGGYGGSELFSSLVEQAGP